MAKPSCVFDLRGTYTVALRVTDSLGETSADTLTVTVLNREPTTSFNHTPLEPTVFQTVQFRDNSTDPDGNVTAWAWDFGDGDTSRRKDPTHGFEDKGTHRVTLTVEDDDGNTDTVTKSVTVENPPPSADFTTSTAVAQVDDEVRFTDASTDPEAHQLGYSWDFGDGSTSDASSPSHRYEEAGYPGSRSHRWP